MEHDINVMRICVEAYLNHIRFIDLRINAILDKIESIRSSIELTAASTDSINGSSDGDRIAIAISKMDELTEELHSRINAYQTEYDKAYNFCSESMGKYALWLKYVEHSNWNDISDALGYSVVHTKRLAYGSLEEVYTFIPEEYRRFPIPNALPR